MKTLIAMTVFCFTSLFTLQAAQEREVTSLNMDECWVGDIQENAPLKVAHFGAGQSWQMGSSDYNFLLQQTLDEMALHGLLDSKNSLETLLHCSSYGASVVLNIKTPDARVCVWADFKGDELQLQRLGVEPMGHNGHCTGAIPGDLILSLAPGSDERDLKNELMEQGLWDSQTDLRHVARGVYAVSLSKKFWFKEEKIIQKLQKQKSRSKTIRAAELNFYPHSVGEFYKLERLSGEL